MSDNAIRTPEILECTLRDGSYSINFGFTARDTAFIAQALEAAGFRLIELGHGVGLGASKKGYGVAAETDEGYLEAAARTLTKAKWGMFCIPGIATLDDVDMAASHGMGFIRIGTNVTQVRESEPFIARAKKHGMFVSANFMKSYAMPPEQFGQTALLSEAYGADVLCVVDSAGGMLPGELDAYFQAVRDVSDIALGFHGHNNLGLAVAHSLRALEHGATVIDTTLQGMGRGGGNAPSEMVVSALLRMGIDLGIDPVEICELGERHIRPLLRKPGHSSLDVISGYSQFHSSYMSLIRDFSSRFDVDPRRLIMAVCERDKVNAPENLVREEALRLSTESKARWEHTAFGFNEYYGNEQN